MVRPGHRLSASAPLLALVLALSVTLAAQEAPRRADTRRPALVEQGLAFLKSNDLDRARGSFEKALARNPTSGEIHYLLGVVDERRKDLAAAAASYASAIRYEPAMAKAHDRLGFLYGQLGRTEEAVREFERAVQLSPRSFDAQ
jgi:Tfp pilus assembly protein PilF